MSFDTSFAVKKSSEIDTLTYVIETYHAYFLSSMRTCKSDEGCVQHDTKLELFTIVLLQIIGNRDKPRAPFDSAPLTEWVIPVKTSIVKQILLSA